MSRTPRRRLVRAYSPDGPPLRRTAKTVANGPAIRPSRAAAAIPARAGTAVQPLHGRSATDGVPGGYGDGRTWPMAGGSAPRGDTSAWREGSSRASLSH